MKHLIGLLTLALFTTTSIRAQKTTICTQLPRLIQESSTAFKNIIGDDLPTTGGEVKKLESKIIIEGTSKCFISKSSSLFKYDWYAEFGDFNSSAEAQTKLDAVLAEFQSCSPQIELIQFKNAWSKLPYYTMKENYKGGFFIYKQEFGIYETGSNKFTPYFKVPEKSEVVKTFGILTNEPDTSNFAKEITVLMSQAKNNFKDIIDEKFGSEFLTVIYKTKFCITGALGCEIEDNFVEKKFKAYAAVSIDSAKADTILTNLSNAVAYSLGKTYVWSKGDDGASFAFTELIKAGVADKAAIIVKKEKSRKENFDVFIIIQKPGLY